MEDQRRKGPLRQDLSGAADRLGFGRREENREGRRGGPSNAVIIFSDGTFVVATPPDVKPADLIAGAIRNNLPQIPELQDELRRFLEDKER